MRQGFFVVDHSPGISDFSGGAGCGKRRFFTWFTAQGSSWQTTVEEGPGSIFKGFVQGEGMKIFVPGFGALYDTASGPDSEFKEGPRVLFAPRLNSIQNT